MFWSGSVNCYNSNDPRLNQQCSALRAWAECNVGRGALQTVAVAGRCRNGVRFGVNDEPILNLPLVKSLIIGNSARKSVESFGELSVVRVRNYASDLC